MRRHLMVRIVRVWANDMAWAPKQGAGCGCRATKSMWKTLPGGLFDRHAWKLRGVHALSLLRSAHCAAQWEPCDTRFWQICDDGWTVDSTTRGGWQRFRVMQVMFVLELEFALSKSDAMAPQGLTRIGLQDDMTFVGSAAALNRSWNDIERSLADAGHRLRGAADRVSRSVQLANVLSRPHRRLRGWRKALATVQNIERFACDQHDHVSFVKAWTRAKVLHIADGL